MYVHVCKNSMCRTVRAANVHIPALEGYPSGNCGQCLASPPTTESPLCCMAYIHVWTFYTSLCVGRLDISKDY